MPVLLLLTLLSGQATAPEAPATPGREAVSGQEAPVEREGRVELECRVQRDRHVTDCVILSETPAGQGFGEAALNAARRARLAPRSVDGVVRDGKVRFTTTFRLT